MFDAKRIASLDAKRIAGLSVLLSVLLSTPLSVTARPCGARAGQAADAGGARRVRFLRAAGASTDAATGLPTRVVHRASGVVLVLIPAGEFLMGSPAGEAERLVDERRHRRVITRPFYLGETEVTAGQFRRFARDAGYRTDAERGVEEGGHRTGAFAATPDGDRRWTASASWRSAFPNLGEYRARDDHPVVHVSWNDARRFAEHYGLLLPTEAQWEYAARAGSRTRFPWGDDEGGGAGHGNVQDASGRRRFPAWNTSFSFDDGVALLAPVGRYRPNAWGVRDAVGNVAEWCRDVYREDYPADGTDERAAVGGLGEPRVIRGGSWLDAPDSQRPAKRIGFEPQRRRDFVGFRVAASAEAVR
jgi:formylglycine-generating enzyme required for sulfatase activity